MSDTVEFEEHHVERNNRPKPEVEKWFDKFRFDDVKVRIEQIFRVNHE